MMKKLVMGVSLVTAVAAFDAAAMHQVYDEVSLQQAIAAANADGNITRIIFKKNVQINLTSPVVYNGAQALTLIGNGATIDGSLAGSFVLDPDLTAITQDGTLVFNTAGDISVRHLTVANSATRGIVINVPGDADSGDMVVNLDRVNIIGSALYGLHIDDNEDEFDDGVGGSAMGIDLHIANSNFIGNGTGAIDFDGVRVDERGEGNIEAFIIHTHIDGNGGDGMELDEAGDGNVNATLVQVTLNHNGFFNAEDLDDGFDIDEADDGDLEVNLFAVEVKGNMDEGLDFDEAGAGNLKLSLSRVDAMNNNDEALKADEEDDGDLELKLHKVKAKHNGDDGMQFTELGAGAIKGMLSKVTAEDNAKYGLRMEQWVIEDEAVSIEAAGVVKVRQISLEGNGKGDEIKINNIHLQ